MDLLLDTNALIWWVQKSPRMAPAGYAAIADPANSIKISYVAAWEIAIKSALGKLPVPPNVASWLPGEIESNRFELLEIKLWHVLGVEHLPQHHRDPFDRLLIAQARAEKLTLLTGNPHFAPYDVNVLRC